MTEEVVGENRAPTSPGDVVECVDGLVEKAWGWGHDCNIDDIHTIAQKGDSYNEGQRENVAKATLAVKQAIVSLDQQLGAMTESRDRTRSALEKMRAERDVALSAIPIPPTTDERPTSDATARMAKTLGVDFVRREKWRLANGEVSEPRQTHCADPDCTGPKPHVAGTAGCKWGDMPRAASDDEVGRLARKLLGCWDKFQASDANHQQAYHWLAKYPWSDWEALRAALLTRTKASAVDDPETAKGGE